MSNDYTVQHTRHNNCTRKTKQCVFGRLTAHSPAGELNNDSAYAFPGKLTALPQLVDLLRPFALTGVAVSFSIHIEKGRFFFNAKKC